MQRIGIFESLLSAAVIALGAGFLVFLLWQTGTGSLASYQINARVKAADGLKAGTDVRIGGVKVGTVESLALDRKTYLVDLRLSIRDGIKVPVDSQLGVGSGMLSSAALSITPGRAKETVAPGGVLVAQ